MSTTIKVKDEAWAGLVIVRIENVHPLWEKSARKRIALTVDADGYERVDLTAENARLIARSLNEAADELERGEW